MIAINKTPTSRFDYRRLLVNKRKIFKIRLNLRLSLMLRFIVVIILASGCGGGNSNGVGGVDNQPDFSSPYSVRGYIQKGPFISGSTIIIQELDNSFNPTGITYQTSTNDDFGSFTIDSSIQSNFVEIIATGFYFDEVAGRLSDANLTLRCVADLSTSDNINVNILTTLSKERLVHLTNDEHLSFEDAQKQAEIEVLSTFNITDNNEIDFYKMDISQSGESNAILLAISSILQYDNTVAQLSEDISHISLDLKEDGIVETTSAIYQKVMLNKGLIDGEIIISNLRNRYLELGVEKDIPDIDSYLNTAKVTFIGQVEAPNANFHYNEEIIIKDNNLFLSSTNGLFAYDIGQPDSPQLLTIIGDNLGELSAFYIYGDYAYVVEKATSKLYIYDISNVSSATELSNLDFKDPNAFAYCQYIYATESYVFIPYGNAGLIIVDVTNKYSPQTISKYNFGEYKYADSVCVSGNYAYVAMDGLQVLDISNPRNPVLAGSYENVFLGSKIIINSNYAYVTTSDDNYKDIAVVDIADPTSPFEASQIFHTNTNDDFLSDLAISGSTAFIAAGKYLEIVDLTNVLIPSAINIIKFEDQFSKSLVIHGQYLYVSCYSLTPYSNESFNGLLVYKLSEGYDGG
jgi:hypothetical protein